MGKRVRTAREGQKLSLRKLGLMTGINYQYISNIEKGRANPTVDKLERLAGGLDIDIKDLF